MTFLYIIFKTQTYAICYLYLTTISVNLDESNVTKNKDKSLENWNGIHRDSDDLSLFWLRRHHFVEVHEFIPKID